MILKYWVTKKVSKVMKLLKMGKRQLQSSLAGRERWLKENGITHLKIAEVKKIVKNRIHYSWLLRYLRNFSIYTKASKQYRVRLVSVQRLITFISYKVSLAIMLAYSLFKVAWQVSRPSITSLNSSDLKLDLEVGLDLLLFGVLTMILIIAHYTCMIL